MNNKQIRWLLDFIYGKPYSWEYLEPLPEHMLVGSSLHYVLESQKYRDLYLGTPTVNLDGDPWYTYSHNWEGCASHFPTKAKAEEWCREHPDHMETHQLVPRKVVETTIRVICQEDKGE